MTDARSLFEGEAAGQIEARLLITTVEGNEFPVSYALKDGEPCAQAKEVALGQPVDAQLLIAFLRSERPIGSEIRNWLADMLDPAVSTKANLRLASRAGAPEKSMLEYKSAVEAYLDRREAGDGYDAAIADVAPRFGMTQSLLRKAVTRLAEGVKICRETNRICNSTENRDSA